MIVITITEARSRIHSASFFRFRGSSRVMIGLPLNTRPVMREADHHLSSPFPASSGRHPDDIEKEQDIPNKVSRNSLFLAPSTCPCTTSDQPVESLAGEPLPPTRSPQILPVPSTCAREHHAGSQPHAPACFRLHTTASASASGRQRVWRRANAPWRTVASAGAP